MGGRKRNQNKTKVPHPFTSHRNVRAPHTTKPQRQKTVKHRLWGGTKHSMPDLATTAIAPKIAHNQPTNKTNIQQQEQVSCGVVMPIPTDKAPVQCQRGGGVEAQKKTTTLDEDKDMKQRQR